MCVCIMLIFICMPIFIHVKSICRQTDAPVHEAKHPVGSPNWMAIHDFFACRAAHDVPIAPDHLLTLSTAVVYNYLIDCVLSFILFYFSTYIYF